MASIKYKAIIEATGIVEDGRVTEMLRNAVLFESVYSVNPISSSSDPLRKTRDAI